MMTKRVLFLSLNPVLFSFCLFWRDAVMKNNSLSLFAKDEESQRVRRATNRTMLVFFFKFAVSLLMCVNSKAMMIKKYLASNFMKPEGVIDIKSTLSLRRRCTSFLSFENGSLTRWYFLTHTQKKYSKHAGGIFKQIHTLWREHQRVATKKQ